MKNILLCLLVVMPLLASAQVKITGSITEKATGKPLPGAHILVDNTTLTAVADKEGHFEFHKFKKGIYTFQASFVGFRSVQQSVTVEKDTTLVFILEEEALMGEEVNISATRAQEKSPSTYSLITSREIKKLNTGKDLPFIIQNTPSTVVTSDAGTGIGYTGISIRGSNLTRINVTVNGIPLNDAESQGVWFVDLPDIAASSENIQIQRGVGTSTNGAGAFGASINIMTNVLNQDPYGEFTAAGGSFGTLRGAVRFGTG